MKTGLQIDRQVIKKALREEKEEKKRLPYNWKCAEPAAILAISINKFYFDLDSAFCIVRFMMIFFVSFAFLSTIFELDNFYFFRF